MGTRNLFAGPAVPALSAPIASAPEDAGSTSPPAGGRECSAWMRRKGYRSVKIAMLIKGGKKLVRSVGIRPAVGQRGAR